MKVFATFCPILVLCLTLVISTLAAPATDGCAPGAYACDHKRIPEGIVFCNGMSSWVYVASCDPGQTCREIGRVPHCFD
ncbi:hypothetical protein ONS95_012508 [Cadophora gregata]|uniref:uncharacterized protein n=1 Tax=Cadophora gregata TaxID=51156 RepID=UPI0026DDB480|nr:uncharacterized protein ONS95_012508 [Cadophora gregata]KAK0118204.1 hypothetical protein ONS95_012508 [Cadophora gregata]KAK0123277.1 hypothetical protein ONS96_010275 [Cadophora gregata f. sp. sojae]